MIHTYRFTYEQNKKTHVKHFEAATQTAAILDFEVVTGLNVEKIHAVIVRLDGAGLVR